VSVAAQLDDPSSTLNFFKSVLALRSTVFDDDEWAIAWDPSPAGVLVLRRGADIRCVVNFSGEPFRISDDDEPLVSSSPLTDGCVIDVNSGAWLRTRPSATT
jgi:alpha-glucosidase